MHTAIFEKKKKKNQKSKLEKRIEHSGGDYQILKKKKKKKTIFVEGKNLGAPPLTWGVGLMVGALFLKHVRITCCGDLREMEKRELFF